jgi:two-component system sensor histidine kinase MprB
MGIAAGVAVAVAVMAVAVAAYAGSRSELLGQVDGTLQSQAGQVLHRPPRGGGGPPPGARGPNGGLEQGVFQFRVGEPLGNGDEGLGLDQIRGPAFGHTGIFTVIYANGGTYAPPGQPSRIPADARMKDLAWSGHGQYFTDMTVNGTHIRVLVTGIGPRGALAVAQSLADIDKTLSNELLLLGLIAAGGIALAAVLAVLVARTAVAPIERFTRQTEKIAANPERLEHERVDVVGSDELARLARTFNNTLDALERSVRAQRNLVADASHELRTPIATIRANLQLMRDESLLSPEDREALRADVIEELDDLTALVSDVVELARGSRPGAEAGDVRVDAIVTEALDRARRRAPGLQFVAQLEPTLVRGDGDRIARAVINLLDNASKWSPEGGEVEVSLHEGVFAVRDHGSGFDERDLPHVFDRFYRAKRARAKPGSGLGLAIVRQAAEAHGGFVEAANAPGGGALLRISFGAPVALEDPASTGVASSANP